MSSVTQILHNDKDTVKSSEGKWCGGKDVAFSACRYLPVLIWISTYFYILLGNIKGRTYTVLCSDQYRLIAPPKPLLSPSGKITCYPLLAFVKKMDHFVWDDVTLMRTRNLSLPVLCVCSSESVGKLFIHLILLPFPGFKKKQTKENKQTNFNVESDKKVTEPLSTFFLCP